jgi:hypothetical protein
MRLKAPRWLLFLEGLLLAGALLVLAYKAMTRVLPLPVEALEQARQSKRPDPQAQLLEYYRKYPDRYIRVVDESWVYDPASRTATHFFTLRNLAMTAYGEIEIRFDYQSASGSTVVTRTFKIQGSLAASGSRVFKNFKVKDVPPGIKSVLTTVTKALMVQ